MASCLGSLAGARGEVSVARRNWDRWRIAARQCVRRAASAGGEARGHLARIWAATISSCRSGVDDWPIGQVPLSPTWDQTVYVEWRAAKPKDRRSLTPRIDSKRRRMERHRLHGYETRMVLPKPGRRSGYRGSRRTACPCHPAIPAGLSGQRISLTSIPTKGAALIQLRSAVKAGSPSRFASARQARSPSERPNGLV